MRVSPTISQETDYGVFRKRGNWKDKVRQNKYDLKLPGNRDLSVASVIEFIIKLYKHDPLNNAITTPLVNPLLPCRTANP